MSSPGLNQPFDPGYDVYSMWRDDFRIPSICSIYRPDNNFDYACDSVIAPAPELGAQLWTRNGRRILIGIYKDQGRPDGLRRPPRTVTWVRTVNKMVLTDVAPHRLRVGDEVDVFNTVTPEARLKVLRVVDAYSFEVQSLAFAAPSCSGGTVPSSGSSGGYSPLAPVMFSEQYIVFRFLPSYKVVPWQEVIDLLQAATPTVGTAPVGLVDINTGDVINTTRTVFNGSRLLSSGSRAGTELWRQQFDETGKPLAWTYDYLGRADKPKTVSTRKQNNPPHLSGPVVNEAVDVDGAETTDPTANNQIYVKDFYGFELNDTTRGPYHANDIITYDPDEPNGIKRKTNGGEVIYDGFLHDEFGNFVTAATELNTLVARGPVLPLAVDQFNYPYKRPQPRRTV